jgi:hypothetical protein
MSIDKALAILTEANPSAAPVDLEGLDILDKMDGWNIVNVRKTKPEKVGFYCYTDEGKYDWEGPFRSPKECKIWINKQ